MKKCVSILLAVILLLTCINIGMPKARAATKPEKTRAIAIVFDNSGTMYLGDEDGRKTWCRATYAMQALATMMNDSDTMQIYPMNPIQIGDAENPKDSDVYTRERPLVIKRENASTIQEICTPHAGDTHIEAVSLAREGLAKTKADEKWLIVLTDGTVFYREGKELSKQESVRQLTEEFNQSVQQVNAMYLGIGKEAKSGFSVNGPYQFVERKATNSAQVLANLTELGNIIFGRDELPNVSDEISFDISMKKLIVFIQGNAIDNVALSGAKPVSTSKLTYSTYGAKNKNYDIICDTSLQGTMLTYENLDVGSYKISFSGQADDIAVYYEPDVDLDFVFTSADGSEVDPNALYEGDYKVSFGMKDAKTGELTSSSLLGKPHYEGSYYINGQEYPINHDGYSGETPVTLKMNDTFDANLTATYLGGYTITKDSSDFGWPEGGIQVAARPAGELRLEISGGDKQYSLQDLETGKPYEVKIYYQGTQLTGDELEKVELKWDPERSNADIQKEFAEDHWKLFLHYKDPNAPQNTACGECTVTIYAYYTPPGSDEGQGQSPLTYNIKDDFSPLRLEWYVPETYLVIGDLDESEAYVVSLKLDGAPLTEEEFAAVDMQVDCGGIANTVTPNPKDSSYTIKLLSTDGIKEGDYKIKVTAKYTDHIGRESRVDDSLDITLSTMPLWLRWLIYLGILLILLLIIWVVLHIKVLPKKAHTTKKLSNLNFDGEDVTKSTSFLTEIKKDGARMQTQYGGRKFGLMMDVTPGQESYLYKSQKGRSAEVKPISVRKFGPAKIQEALIGTAKYTMDDETGKLVPAIPMLKPFLIKNGTTVRYSGTIQDAGIDKDFEVLSKISFKK